MKINTIKIDKGEAWYSEETQHLEGAGLDDPITLAVADTGVWAYVDSKDFGFKTTWKELPALIKSLQIILDQHVGKDKKETARYQLVRVGSKSLPIECLYGVYCVSTGEVILFVDKSNAVTCLNLITSGIRNKNYWHLSDISEYNILPVA